MQTVFNFDKALLLDSPEYLLGDGINRAHLALAVAAGNL